jgi:hypothetical protein
MSYLHRTSQTGHQKETYRKAKVPKVQLKYFILDFDFSKIDSKGSQR